MNQSDGEERSFHLTDRILRKFTKLNPSAADPNTSTSSEQSKNVQIIKV